MKKLSVKKGSECMACLACAQACSEAFYKVMDPGRSCIQIVEKNGTPKPSVCARCSSLLIMKTMPFASRTLDFL